VLPIRRPPVPWGHEQDPRWFTAGLGLIGHVKPPAGAPNILFVLIDDAGFGNPSTFGGPIRTPTYDRTAAQGLRYNRFHVTAMCSPIKAALLTGRNHHAVDMCGIPEFSGGFPPTRRCCPETPHRSRRS
jgi:arylsulfatase A-like enzyme